MYGTRRAAQLWQEYAASAFKRNGWTRIAVAAGMYHEPMLDMTAVIHGDDVLTEGEWESLDVLDQQLTGEMDIKSLGRVGPDGLETIKYLKRTAHDQVDRQRVLLDGR